MAKDITFTFKVTAKAVKTDGSTKYDDGDVADAIRDLIDELDHTDVFLNDEDDEEVTFSVELSIEQLG